MRLPPPLLTSAADHAPCLPTTHTACHVSCQFYPYPSSREFLGDILALGRQQRDPGAPSFPDRANRRFLSTLLKGYQQFVLIIALRTMFHRLGKAKTDIIPLNHLVDRVTAKMLAQLAKIRPGAVAEPLRRMAETERGLSRICEWGSNPGVA